MLALHKENIGTGIHYEAVHLQPYYQEKYNIKRGVLKRAEYVSDRTISIPLQTSMSSDDVSSVIKAIKRILNYYKK